MTPSTYMCVYPCPAGVDLAALGITAIWIHVLWNYPFPDTWWTHSVERAVSIHRHDWV